MQAVLPMMILFRVTLILNRCSGPDGKDIGVSSLGNAARNQRVMLVLRITSIYRFRLQFCKTKQKLGLPGTCGTSPSMPNPHVLDICKLPTAPKKARGREPGSLTWLRPRRHSSFGQEEVNWAILQC